MIEAKNELFRWGPIDAAILPLSYPLLASFDKMHDLFDACWPETLVIFDKDNATWINDLDELEKACVNFTEKNILENQNKRKFDEIWNDSVEKLILANKSVANLKDLSDEELKELIKKWNKTYLNFWAVGMTAELINYDLEKRFKEILESKLSDEKELNEAFAILSTPEELSFYKEEEIDLAKIKLSNESLKEHAKEYFWIYNNYLDSNDLKEEFFKTELEKLKIKDAEKIIKDSKVYFENLIEQKKNIFKKINLNEEEKKISDLLIETIILQDKRKKYNLISSSFLEKLLSEVSRRTGLTTRDLKWLLPNELENFTDDIDSIIKKRKNITVINCNTGILDIKIQNQASKIDAEFNEVDFIKNANIQGTVASIGPNKYFRGVAKIILSPKEGHKLEKGNILITTMTTPDYVMFMKKAGAIVTDIGGVTCHAAVVSREFGIPCIVNTKYATKAIKDGDILELHSLRGVVKIIKGE